MHESLYLIVRFLLGKSGERGDIRRSTATSTAYPLRASEVHASLGIHEVVIGVGGVARVPDYRWIDR
jgi:hypothetical protein